MGLATSVEGPPGLSLMTWSVGGGDGGSGGFFDPECCHGLAGACDGLAVFVCVQGHDLTPAQPQHVCPVVDVAGAAAGVTWADIPP